VKTKASTFHTDLYRYWNRVRGRRRTPTRADIDPASIVRLLPFIALIERKHDGFFWRLIGTAIVDHFGRNLTGQRYGAGFLPTVFVDETVATFDAALEHGIPFFDEFIYRSPRAVPHAVSRLVCPLAPNNLHPPMVIHTRVHRLSHEPLGSVLADEAWGEMRDRQPISSVEQLQLLADDWSARDLSNDAMAAPVTV
jgi:hypothetical protein